jgi:hypothetical protein
MTILTTLALLGFSVTTAAHPCKHHDYDPLHEHCAPSGNGDRIYYTAELSGAFVFGPVVVTPNKKKSSLHSNEDLDMVRPGYDLDADPEYEQTCDILDEETFAACQTWNYVFNTCSALLLVGSEDPLVDIFVGEDDWVILKPGGAYIKLEDMPVPGANAKFSIQLVGNKDLNKDPFLPTLDKPVSVFTLDKFATWGSLAPGEGGSLGCEPFENRPLGYYRNDGFFQETPLTLLIRASSTLPSQP